MAKYDYEGFVTPTMVDDMFRDFYIDSENKGWAITVCGKILTINGKMLYKSRKQAVTAFYNSYRWRAMRQMAHAVHPNAEYPYGWWGDASRDDYWPSFKSALEKNYGLKFIQL